MDPIVDMMTLIKQGVKLRKVQTDETSEQAPARTPSEEHANELKKVLSRIHKFTNSDDDDDEEEDNQDFSD